MCLCGVIKASLSLLKAAWWEMLSEQRARSAFSLFSPRPLSGGDTLKPHCLSAPPAQTHFSVHSSLVNPLSTLQPPPSPLNAGILYGSLLAHSDLPSLYSLSQRLWPLGLKLWQIILKINHHS